MGSGSWTTSNYVTYTTTTRGFKSMDDFTSSNVDTLYTQREINQVLNPLNANRECVDTEEHPNTIPVILALDVTGSMGHTLETISKQLNTIMENLYSSVKDIEFCVMAIGDLECDNAPIQMGQFESDIRIAEQLDKVYFERGGGGNAYESYSAAWYMGARHTKLDCWSRGKKGIIITMGDEPLNPYLPAKYLSRVTGDSLQGDVKTEDIYKEACEKFDIFHIGVNDNCSSFRYYAGSIRDSFKRVVGDHYLECDCQNLPATISDIIEKCNNGFDEIKNSEPAYGNSDEGISW